MPTVATVAGVVIRLYYADHEPAHVHAVAGEDEMLVAIADGRVIAGDLPGPQRRAVLAWAAEHRAELALAWVRCRTGVKPGRVGG